MNDGEYKKDLFALREAMDELREYEGKSQGPQYCSFWLRE